MPNYPQPSNGPWGPVWTPITQGLQNNKQQAAQLNAAKQQGAVYDAYYNTVQLTSTNLNQVVTIAAAHMQGGVEIATGIANGTAGTAVQQNLAIGTVTFTKGSTSATLVSTASGTFSGSSHPIGAVDASGNNVLTPGTTYTISGTTITLSQAALESGTALYTASATFSIVT